MAARSVLCKHKISGVIDLEWKRKRKRKRNIQYSILSPKTPETFLFDA